MVTAADTNCFLDILTNNEFAPAARLALADAVRRGPLIVSTVVYAELSPQFISRIELDHYLEKFGAEISEVDADVAFLAGQFSKQYRVRGGTRTRILADFLVAAHAQLCSDRLLTRDHRFFGEHFPNLKAIAPADL